MEDPSPEVFAPRAFLVKLGEKAFTAVQLVLFAATFLLVGGTIGVIIGKPIFLWIMWLWEHYL